MIKRRWQVLITWLYWRLRLGSIARQMIVGTPVMISGAASPKFGESCIISEVLGPEVNRRGDRPWRQNLSVGNRVNIEQVVYIICRAEVANEDHYCPNVQRLASRPCRRALHQMVGWRRACARWRSGAARLGIDASIVHGVGVRQRVVRNLRAQPHVMELVWLYALLWNCGSDAWAQQFFESWRTSLQRQRWKPHEGLPI
jgi:hypothetical protein